MTAAITRARPQAGESYRATVRTSTSTVRLKGFDGSDELCFSIRSGGRELLVTLEIEEAEAIGALVVDFKTEGVPA